MRNFPVKLGQELLKKSNACVEFASAGSVSEARDHLNELRFIRHLFAAELENEQRNIDLQKIDEECKSLIVNINRSLDILKNWLSSIRTSFSIDELLATPEGMEILLDVSLPLTWSWEEDLVLLSGDLPDQIANALISRGQKKSIFLKSGQSTEQIKYIAAPSDAYHSLSEWNTDYIGRSIYIASSPEEAPPKELVEEISQIIQDFRIAQNTRSHFARTWVSQQLQSLNFVIRSHSISALEPAIRGKHCIVVSPGPSLEKNIALLRNRDDGQLLIAVAQAAPALAKHSVEPDYIIVMDPINYSWVLDNTDCSKLKGVIIGDACHTSFFEKNFPHFFIFHNIRASFGVDEIIGSGMLLPGGSVSVGAALLCLIFEASHLTLVGQDLAISEGRYYGGYDEGTDIPQRSMISVPGYYGTQVKTKPDYASFIREFERLALLYSTKTRLTNSTEGGAFIDGFEHTPLAAALRMPSKRGTSFTPKPIAEGEISLRSKTLFKALQAERDILSDTYKNASECLKLINKVDSLGNPKTKVLQRKEKQLSLLTDKSPTLQVFCQLEVSSTLRQIKNTRSFQDNKQLSVKLYTSLMQASNRLRQEISTQLESIKKSF